MVAAGLNDCEIARRLEVPRTTVRDWRRPRYVLTRPAGPRCPLCGEPSRRVVLEAEAYAELLGLYLGDGHITDMARTQRLRIFLDAKYPAIIAAAEALVRALFPENQVGRLTPKRGGWPSSGSTPRTSAACSLSTATARSTTARSCSSRGSASSWRRRHGRCCAA